MNYAKLFSLLVLLSIALMASPGNASASALTNNFEEVYLGSLNAESEAGHTILHSENAPTPFTIECIGAIKSQVEYAGFGEGAITTGGALSSLTFSSCTGGATVVVSKAGTLEVHTDSLSEDGNGTVTSSGAEITVHVPLGFKCVYTTNGTDIGTLTGSKNVVSKIDHIGPVEVQTVGGTATLDINSATIPRTGGSAFCGTGGFWTGSYRVTTPSYVDVD